MSKEEHESYLKNKALAAHEYAVQLARLQDAFLDQVRNDIDDADLTALDELFYNMLKIPGAIPILIGYLPEGAQEPFLELIASEPEVEL
jgi:hypothetical protein